MNKNLAIVCTLILVTGGLYAYYAGDPNFRKQQMPRYVGEQTDTQTGVSTTPAPVGVGKHAVNWNFEQVGEGTFGDPLTKVTVSWDGVSHDAGTYSGTCAEIDGSSGTLREGEVSGVLCWWAGAGDEIGVFSENGTFVLKHGEQQEPSAEAQGFRGNFKTLITL